MANEVLHGFRLLESRPVPALSAVAHRYVHEYSGAELLYVENNDPEKVFSIAFKTIPDDSTGVFHILEHSVLCGSDKYPLREPFVDLLKGSMQTFLNAMTFGDKTMYPVASMNEKDFLNLMSIYLDAVFCPRIYSKKEIFMQEGWHLELPDDGDPYFNGVVYNEMKGAYSNADSVMWKLLQNALFPDITYGYSSGGDPAVIPELTYEGFLDHHRKFYHPENSYIFLYGEMNLEEKLAYIDREYLSKRPKTGNQISIPEQKPIGFSVKNSTYSISEQESLESNALLCMGYVYGDYSARQDILLMDIICEAIAGNNEAPLKKAVLASGAGKEFSAYTYSTKYATLVFELHKGDETKAEQFKSLIEDAVRDICQKGIDRDALIACLNAREFSARENEHYGPAGINYATEVMDGWLYGGDPIPYLTVLDVLADIRSLIHTNAPEELLSRVVLESEHGAMVVLTPSKTLSEEQAKVEREKALALAASLSDSERAQIKKENEALRLFQTEEDSPEAKATLPRLSLSDLNDECSPDIPTEERTLGNVPVLYHPIDTNGILYAKFYFDVSRLSLEDMSRVSLLCRMLGSLPTEQHSTVELDTAIKTHLGSLFATTETMLDKETGEIHRYVSVSASALAQNVDKVMPLAAELALTTRFDEEEVKHLLQQEVIYGEQYLIGAGSSFALRRAQAAKKDVAKYIDATEGYGYLTYIRKALADYEKTSDYCAQLSVLAQEIFTQSPLLMSLSCQEELYQEFAKTPLQFVNNCCQNTENTPVFGEYSTHHGISIPAAVAFDGMCMDYTEAGYSYTGKMAVASRIISLDYLWNAVRVRGGAYGVSMSFDDNGVIGFSSYRDPHVKETLDAFRDTATYLRNFETDKESMEGYIISVISGMDKPLRPKMKAKIGDIRYLTHNDQARRRKIRCEALSTTIEDMHALADVIEAVADNASLCVVAASAKIEDNKSLFDTITT